jgi:hypothetical protein
MTDNLTGMLCAQQEHEYEEESLWRRWNDWVRTELVWYAASFTLHLVGLSGLLLLGNFATGQIIDAAPRLDAFSEPQEKNERTPDLTNLQHIEIPPPSDDFPEQLNVEPPQGMPGQSDVEALGAPGDESPNVSGIASAADEGGSMGGGICVYAPGPGPKLARLGGIGIGNGRGFGNGEGDGIGNGFKHRLKQGPGIGPSDGRTIICRHRVTGALVWLARHQLPDGSWSLKHSVRCADKTCTGEGNVHADAGATAMGLLPFLGAGLTHRYNGPYQATIAKGINWLIRHQKPDGDLASGCEQPMYSHGLATIALCEAYGLSGDRNIGLAAQAAVNFIVNAQNKETGGWRYRPQEEGDTSVVGWQIMALKSAQMAGLQVPSGSMSPLNTGSKWLDSVKSGPADSRFSYQPDRRDPSNTMTSVGLLCRQYLGMHRDDPAMTEGVKYLMANQPDQAARNVYYWYYASQVMHNMLGYDWDTWNRKMRRILVDTQCRDTGTCANGSWDPAGDVWAQRGGRLMMTSLSALTLEIYYRYLPLFKTELEGAAAAESH